MPFLWIAIFLTGLAIAQEEASISLSNMAPPKTELFYSQEFPEAGDTLYMKIVIPQGWSINSDKVQDDFLIPSHVEPIADGIEFGAALWPEPFALYNEILKIELLLLQDSFTVALPINAISKGYNPYNAKLKFTYQACSRICLAPRTIEVSFGESFSTGSTNTSSLNETKKKKKNSKSLLIYILFALLGGLLLNVMPCVLPVLFIKIFDIMRRTGETRRNMFKWGLATTGGILFSFAIIAAVVLAARLGGDAVGWGFQFQHPAYTAAMALCIALFALNLWGVFEIWMPGNILKAWENQSKREGFYGAFAYGILLVLLSTPCSAPFLGTAVGFAFAASNFELLVIFFSLAMGLALPYLLLSAFPGWAKKLPRPGEWMVVFKQFLGFPLLLTFVWLLWVFYRQAGIDAALSLSIIICAAAFFAWLAGILANPGKPWWRFAFLWLVFALIYLLSWSLWIKPQINIGTNKERTPSEWLSFSQKKLDSLQSKGIAVWVNGTADWCITCKVNEKNIFENEKIKRIFEESFVVKMQADYTNPNKEASRLFAAYGRSGVPFDLLLSPSGEAILMPEILYADTVVRALTLLTVNP
jgi:thiol:disulfide interchange protein DsbD